MDLWKQDPKVVMETVAVTRDYLNGELAKYETWEDVPRGLANSLNLNNRSAFANVKTKGIGQPTILGFLGRAWQEHVVRDALAALDADVKCQAILCGFSPDLLLSSIKV